MRCLPLFYIICLCSCDPTQNKTGNIVPNTTDTLIDIAPATTTIREDKNSYATDPLVINTGTTTPGELVDYAKLQIGIPYKYGSIDPQQGFDCSGFITYVFSHFNIQVPRSSVEFTDAPHEVVLTDAKPGDLILFTGTDSTIRTVGHMGIITSNENNEIAFIHSTSGKKYGVTITVLNDSYKGRFVKVVRVFQQNDE